MSAMLKQKLIDIANGFTKYGLWKGGGGTEITVDSELSNTSTNPVQNKVITSEINNLNNNFIKKCSSRYELASHSTATLTEYNITNINNFTWLQIIEYYQSYFYVSTIIPVDAFKIMGVYTVFDGYGNINVGYNNDEKITLKSAYDGRTITVFGLK